MPFVTEELWPHVREDGEGLLAGVVRPPLERRASTRTAERALGVGDRGDAGGAALARRVLGAAGARARRARSRAAPSPEAAALLARIARLELRDGDGERRRDDRGRRAARSRSSRASISPRTRSAAQRELREARRRDRARARQARERRSSSRTRRPQVVAARAREAGRARAPAGGAVTPQPRPGTRAAGPPRTPSATCSARERFGMRFGLDRMHRLMNVLELPTRALPDASTSSAPTASPRRRG